MGRVCSIRGIRLSRLSVLFSMFSFQRIAVVRGGRAFNHPAHATARLGHTIYRRTLKACLCLRTLLIQHGFPGILRFALVEDGTTGGQVQFPDRIHAGTIGVIVWQVRASENG